MPPLSKQDLNIYRQDEQLGGAILEPDHRITLLKPYLPAPKAQHQSSRFGVRRFLSTQFHLLVYTLIHTVFSVYIRFRQAYHAVLGRIFSIFHYHHRTPQLIEGDVRRLRRLPKHLSVILHLDDDERNDGALEKLVNEAADIAAWCASAGIPQLSIYEKTGILKGILPETHGAIAQKLAAYFGRNFPALALNAPHMPSKESAASPQPDGPGARQLSVMLLSAEDGRDSIVDLTQTLAEMAQRHKISPDDISSDLVDAELTESVVGEPDLLILFGPHVRLNGYPPWQIRLTEIFHVQDNQGVEYQVFYLALKRYAQAQFRKGK